MSNTSPASESGRRGPGGEGGGIGISFSHGTCRIDWYNVASPHRKKLYLQCLKQLWPGRRQASEEDDGCITAFVNAAQL